MALSTRLKKQIKETLCGAVYANELITAIENPSAVVITGEPITGFVSGAGSVTATDSILTAFNKIVGNVALKANLISPALVTPNLGTPTAGVLTSCTGLPLTSGVTGVLPVANFTTGTPNGTKFVRDDGVLATVPSGGTTVQVAYLSEVQAYNVNGGTFTQDAWQTRVLNTEVDTSSIVTLASNQFTLVAGTYDIEAFVPAYRVGRNTAKLRNITDSTDALIGGAAYARPDIDTNNSNSIISGQVIIAGTKVFEIEHYCDTTGTTTGFGINTNIAGTNSVYTNVKITKRA